MVDRNRVEDQMDGMLSEFTGVDTTPAPERKGLSYGQLLIDNIVGLDNGYDSFGEKLGRAFNDDEVGFLKQAGISAWEGAKQFVSHPIQTTEEVVTDIKDSVVRLGTEDLDSRLQRMYGVDYTQASDEQVNQAREAVFGDALEAANLIPAGGAALKLGRTTGKTGVAADVIGTTRALASGDLDFLGGTPTPRASTAGVSETVDSALDDLFIYNGELDFPNPGEASPKLTSTSDPFIDMGTISKYEDPFYTPVDLEDWFDVNKNQAVKNPVFSSFSDDELVAIAGTIPDWKNPVVFSAWKDSIASEAEKANIPAQFLEDAVYSLKNYLPEPELEASADFPIPKRQPIGEPAGDQIRRAQGLSPVSRENPAADALGFTETVYHSTPKNFEFTRFKGGDPEAGLFDALGTHVGTARAARDRWSSTSKAYADDSATGMTMELRARTDMPATDFLTQFLDDHEQVGDVLSEEQVRWALKKIADTNPNTGNMVGSSEDLRYVSNYLTERGFTHIPYKNDVEDVGSTSYIMLTSGRNGPAVLRDVRAAFDPDWINESDLRFAEGGEVKSMEQQMNLFEEGGLSDDGMTKEPVTGNEIPPGSMASEVRDDVPAMLSEGEYVVPADVVRYYGVRFFEDLRGQAKTGLQDMEADGRIGGEPAGPAGLSEEDMAMLQQVAAGQQQGGYAEGGMVNQPLNEDALIDNIINVAKNNPALMGKLNQRGVMLYEGGMVKPEGYADGGSVGSPTFNPADWATVGGSYFGPSTSYQAPIENRTYRGPNGESITVRFQNGVAIDTIPTGFVPEDQYKNSSVVSSGVPENTRNDNDQPWMGVATPSAPTASSEPDDPTVYRGVSFEDPLGAGADALEKATGGSFMNKVLATGATLLGGPALGTVVKEGLDMNQMSAARANLRVARELGLEGADELEAKIEAELEKMGVGENLANEIFASGNSRFEGAWDQFSKFGLTTPTAAEQLTSVSSRVTPKDEEVIGTVTGSSDGGSSKDSTYRGVDYTTTSSQTADGKYVTKSTAKGSTAPTSSPRPVSRPSNLNTSGSSSSSSSSSSGLAGAKAYAEKTGTKMATGGRARGGLMGKANKT